MTAYGKAPTVLGQFRLECPEMMFVQYLPIAMPDTAFRVPDNLQWIYPLLWEMDRIDRDDYVYITAKHMYQAKGESYNRLGFHTDGFGTEDINYLWSDCNPTEFYVQDFELSDDHEKSMVQMGEQALATRQVLYPNNTLLKLDQYVVHRVNKYAEDGMRTFVKISVSKDRYNLQGNSHNYLFDYSWEMVERKNTRNCPQQKQGEHMKTYEILYLSYEGRTVRITVEAEDEHEAQCKAILEDNGSDSVFKIVDCTEI